MLHVMLWAPQAWISPLLSSTNPALAPSRCQVTRWLLQLFTETLLETLSVDGCDTEHQLKCCFLQRLDLAKVMQAVDTLWSI